MANSEHREWKSICDHGVAIIERMKVERDDARREANELREDRQRWQKLMADAMDASRAKHQSLPR